MLRNCALSVVYFKMSDVVAADARDILTFEKHMFCLLMEQMLLLAATKNVWSACAIQSMSTHRKHVLSADSIHKLMICMVSGYG